MNDLQLIQNLTKDLKPVTPQKPFLTRWLTLLALCIGACAVGVLYWFIKKAEFHIPDGRSALELLSLLATFSATTYLATRSVSPVSAEPRHSKTPYFSFAAWVVILLTAFLNLYISDPQEATLAWNYNTWLCPIVILSIAIPTALISLLYLVRGAILYGQSTFFYWSLTSLTSGAIGLSFICPWADPLHELLWHVVPVVVATAILFKVQCAFFAWKKRQSFLK